MKKLLPLVLLFVGAGAGVGAGIFLRPEAPVEQIDAAESEESEQDDPNAESEMEEPAQSDEEAATNAYVKLSNQFVIPIVTGEKVTALVVLALSIETPEGQQDTVYLREPKLRDSFLQVLFDHANIGGFEGNFTDAKVLDRLRSALLEVAQKDVGKKIVKDVLIIEIARQDY